MIQTEERDLTPLEAIAAYKELNEVERGFAQLNLNPAVGRLDLPQPSESTSDGDRSKWNLKVTISTAPQLQS